MVAAGRGVEQDQRAHDKLRAGSYRGRGEAEQQPGWRGRSATIALGDDGAVSSARELTHRFMV